MNRKVKLLAVAALSLFSIGHSLAGVGEGGCSVYHYGEYTVHVFRENGTFTFDGSRNVDVLLVGGGGAGGAFHGGGGGGGGVLILPNASLSKGTYQIVVGRGGDGSQTVLDNRAGGSSSIKIGDEVVWTAPGGGGGGCQCVGGDGASGGGGGMNTGTQEYSGGSGQEGFGFGGGKGIGNSRGHFWRWGGGGGGAGAPGENAWYIADAENYSIGNCGAGKGGDGRYCDFSGTNVCYGGGGGGGSNGRPSDFPRDGALGGNGGGGKGKGYETSEKYEPSHKQYAPYCGENGVDGLGGGGGGGGSYSSTAANGGNGGSGIVILRYRSDLKLAFEKVTAEGGDLKRLGSDNFVCTFTNNGSFTVSGNSYVDVLLVGGGGGGGSFHGGGGGGGGVIITNSIPLYEGTYSIKVGEGGTSGWADSGVDYVSGGNGGNTEVDFGYVAFTAFGGGGGATVPNAAARKLAGKDGASGGGGSVRNDDKEGNDVSEKGGAGIQGQGYDGGMGYANKGGGQFWQWGGGGGGAGEKGGDAWYTDAENCGAGKGGDGLCCDFTGEAIYYGGGGGGGSNGRPNTNPRIGALGGLGGGGSGAGYEPSDGHAIAKNTAYCGENGIDGLGGGGGGGGSYANTTFGLGGKGGCGAVIIRFRRKGQGIIIRLK